MFFVVAFGASALTDMFSMWHRQLSTAGTTAAGIFDMVFDLSTRARRHSYLRHEYFGIGADLTLGTLGAAEASSAMLRLAADEDPPFYAAHALAENWATKAVCGDGDAPCKVGRWHRLLRHVIRFDGHSFAG